MIQLKNKTKDLLLYITKKFETFIHQTHTKPKETFEFTLTKRRETILFNLRISVEGS